MSLFSFQGRLNRLDYARSFFVSYIVMMGAALLGVIGAHNLDPTFPTTHIPAALVGIEMPHAIAVLSAVVGILVVLAFMVYVLSIDVRRFHDCNISGWFVLVWFVILAFVPDRDLGEMLPSLQMLIWTALMITVPGTQGPNRYGTAPGAPAPVAG